MNTPEWLKPGLYGALIGAAVVGIGGFTWGGWMTGGGAEKMASSRSRDEVIAALVPVCMDLSRTDTDRVAKLAAIQAATTYQRRDILMQSGWATMPGSLTPNAELATACVAALAPKAS